MTKKADAIIRFQAQVRSIKTLESGGMDVTLWLSDRDIKQISKLLECKKLNAVLDVTAILIKPEPKAKEQNGKPRPRRVQRYPYRADA